MTRGRWLVVAAALIAAAVVIVAVRAVSHVTAEQAAPPMPPAFDPPATFAASGVALPRRTDADPLPILLQGLDAVVGLPDGLEVLDTRTGDTRLTVPALQDAPASPSGEKPAQVTGTQPTTPLLVTVAGRPAVAVAFQVSAPGHGTTLGHEAVQLLAVDAAGYAPVARTRIDLPVSLSDSGRLRAARIVGEDGGLLIVVAELGADGVPTTYAVDPVTGHLAWQQAGFDAAVVVLHRVVGLLGAGGSVGGVRVTALGADDGRPAWTAPGPPARSAAAWTAGPALVAVTTTDAVTGARTLQMLDAATGAAREVRPTDAGVTCRYDERSVTVCAEAGRQAWAAGFDATSGRRLWELPDAAAGRVAPEVSTTWHGLVYGETQNGPVALDARTGADRPTSPGAAPDLVNGYVGISAATLATPHPTAYQTTS